MAIRTWHTSQALASYPTLASVINELTEEEVLWCLSLEAGSTRRKSIIDRLISRAARLRELSYVAELKEKFHGTTPVENPHHSR